MKAIKENRKTSTHDFGSPYKLALIALAVFALVMLPYKVDLNKGLLKATVLLADESGGDSDHDSDSSHDSSSGHDIDSDHDSDSDNDGDYNSGYDDDHDADRDGEDSHDHDSDNQNSSHDGSIERDSSAEHSDELLEVGGMQGLSEVSPEDEASLVGNWGKSSTK